MSVCVISSRGCVCKVCPRSSSNLSTGCWFAICVVYHPSNGSNVHVPDHLLVRVFAVAVGRFWGTCARNLQFVFLQTFFRFLPFPPPVLLMLLLVLLPPPPPLLPAPALACLSVRRLPSLAFLTRRTIVLLAIMCCAAASDLALGCGYVVGSLLHGSSAARQRLREVSPISRELQTCS